MSDKITTLSAAIRYGSTFIGESKQFFGPNFVGPFTCGCAVGTAYLATVDKSCDRFINANQLFAELAERFAVPVDVVEQVSGMHWRGDKTRAQCADWLEAQGY